MILDNVSRNDWRPNKDEGQIARTLEARSRRVLPDGKRMREDMASSNSAHVGEGGRGPIPISRTCTRLQQLVRWSSNWGQPMMGTPEVMVSRVEFQPQCVRKPPTDGCEST